MATKKISELEAINAAEDNDVLVIVDTSESTTNKITKGNLLIGAGHTIEMTLNENYQIVLVLKNAAGTALSTQTIDLPNENAVTNLAYNNGILTVTKQSGATSQINLTGLIEGLVTESDFNTFKEALQTTLEAINEKDAEQDEAIAENYKVINKLNEKLENQQKVIDQLPQVPGQGTSITLENTIEATFTKFDVEGNSDQESTKGYQLLNPADFSDSLTNNGITFTNNGDGSITINGTSTGTAMLQLDKIKKTLKAGKYTFSLTNGIKDKLYMIWSAPYNSTNTIGTDMLYKEVTFDSDTELTYIYIQIPSGHTFNNVVVYPMIYEGSYDSSKPWEKYTGEIASPNPNYEQPIYSAGDNENLVNESNINFIYSSVNKVIYDNGLIKTINSPNGQFYEFDEPLESGETYTLTFKFVQGRVNVQGSQDFSIGMYHTGNNNSWQGNLTKTQIANIDLAGKTFTLTHKATDTITGLYIFIYSSPTFVTPLWFNVKVEKGNKASGYSPYGMGSINEKIQTRNIINIIRTLGTPSNTGYDNTNKRTFDVTTLIKFLTANNYYNAGVQIDYSLIDKGIKITTKQAGYGIGFPVILNSAKTYTISANIDVIDNQMIRAIFYKEDGTYISNVTSSGTNKFLTFTTTDDTYFVVVMLTPKANVETTYSNIMLNEGNTAIPYVPHEEQDYSIFVQQPMRSIGDVRDCFVKKSDGKWYKYEVIKKIILTGNENWIYYTNIGEPYFFYTPDYTNIIKNKIVDNSIILCNYFQNRGKAYKPSGQGIFVNANFSGKIENGNLSVTTYDWGNDVETFKQFLREKKPEVYFAVKEPTEIEITDETLIAQLDAMQELRTYKNVTHISSEDETEAYLEVSGIRDINTMFDKVTNAIVSLGGNV